jgi:protein-disulfide isomerase
MSVKRNIFIVLFIFLITISVKAENHIKKIKEIENHILEDRIEGTKKYKVNATPTLIINEKKFDKSLNYKNLKKIIEKNL